MQVFTVAMVLMFVMLLCLCAGDDLADRVNDALQRMMVVVVLREGSC